MKTGIIIPCFNEANSLNVEAFISFIQKNDDYHLCFVNNGSKDNTLEVLHHIKNQRTIKVSIIDMKKNKGKAAAVRVGARYFFNRHDVDYIGSIEADLSIDFSDIERLVQTIHENKDLSLIYGSKELGNGKIGRNYFNGFLSKIVAFFLLGFIMTDLPYSTKVYRTTSIPKLYNNEFNSVWSVEIELMKRIKKYFGSEKIMRLDMVTI